MNQIVLFVITAFAIWRVCVLIVADRGPFDVLSKMRMRIDPQKKTWVGDGIRCVGCISFWLGFIVAIIYHQIGWIGDYDVLLWWWALSGLAFFIDLRSV